MDRLRQAYYGRRWADAPTERAGFAAKGAGGKPDAAMLGLNEQAGTQDRS